MATIALAYINTRYKADYFGTFFLTFFIDLAILDLIWKCVK